MHTYFAHESMFLVQNVFFLWKSATFLVFVQHLDSIVGSGTNSNLVRVFLQTVQTFSSRGLRQLLIWFDILFLIYFTTQAQDVSTEADVSGLCFVLLGTVSIVSVAVYSCHTLKPKCDNHPDQHTNSGFFLMCNLLCQLILKS